MPQQVEGEFCVQQEEVPLVYGEQWCNARQDGRKVIFKCADGTFGCILAVHVWWDQLDCAVIGGNGTLEGLAGFIARNVEGWLVACGDESGKDVVVSSNVVGIYFGGI